MCQVQPRRIGADSVQGGGGGGGRGGMGGNRLWVDTRWIIPILVSEAVGEKLKGRGGVVAAQDGGNLHEEKKVR